jgi:RecB family endonuclease NucS
LEDSQVPVEGGRIDLVYKDSKGGYVLVELKLGSIGTDALNQLRRYMSFYKSKTTQNVRGVLVCKDIMPAFEEKYQKLKNIKVMCYGWKLAIIPCEFE